MMGRIKDTETLGLVEVTNCNRAQTVLTRNAATLYSCSLPTPEFSLVKLGVGKVLRKDRESGTRAGKEQEKVKMCHTVRDNTTRNSYKIGFSSGFVKLHSYIMTSS